MFFVENITMTTFLCVLHANTVFSFIITFDKSPL